MGWNAPLHLPLRYEDETRLLQLRQVRDGEMAQVEGRVTHCEVNQSGQRQLLVTLDDGTGTCLLRFFTFYPSMQKALTPVYPTSAGLRQSYLRQAVQSALVRVKLSDTVPAEFMHQIGL